MANAQYKAIMLDLFDTIVKWDPERLPLLEWRGRQVRSTAPVVFPALQETLGTRFDSDAYLTAHDAVYREIFAQRSADAPIEITCLERFSRTLALMGVDGDERSPLAEKLRKIHMGWVRKVTEAPGERVAALRRLRDRYRLSVLSNFDDAETGHQIVGDTGLYDRFDSVVISADVGLRKPNPKIYQLAIERMKLPPEEILFVGDDASCDVLGPKRAGMRAVWINLRKAPLPEDVPAPDLQINDLAELPAALGV